MVDSDVINHKSSVNLFRLFNIKSIRAKVINRAFNVSSHNSWNNIPITKLIYWNNTLKTEKTKTNKLFVSTTRNGIMIN